MPMRTDCRHYESRTYPSGDTVRKCRLDLAPEAPWRCPADCPRFERRTADVGWNYGSLRESAVEPEPEQSVEMGDDVAALLDEAEDIVNTAGRDIVAEIEAKQRRKGGLGRLKPKRRKKR
jgi:hypothetical protein